MLRASDGSQEKDRGVALAGPSAVSWLADRGLVPRPQDSVIKVAGDTIRTEDFAILRIWHTASRISRSPTRGGQVIGFVLEGHLHLDADATGIAIGPSEGYYYESSSELQERTAGSTAVLEAHLSAEAGQRLGVRQGEGLIKIRSGLTSSRVFVAVVSTILSAPVRSSDLHFLDLRRSAESALKGILNEASLVDESGNRSRSERLRRRASAIIERRHWDPGFTVAILIEESGVSRSGLHAAFAEIGTTPLMEIRRARVKTVTAMLGKRDLTVKEISLAAGFRSIQAMRRALQRDREEADLDKEEPDESPAAPPST